MFRQIRSGIIVAALSALSLGCSQKNDSSTTDQKASTATQSTQLVPISFDEWESTRASYAPAIVVVDLWATWCTPCLERFPHMVDMHNAYRDRGVQFVSLSLDDREDLSSVEFAQTFLQEQKAVFPNFLLDENIMEGFELIGIQTVPAVNIYDRNGILVYELNNNNPNKQFTDEDIENAIKDLLDESGGVSGQ